MGGWVGAGQQSEPASKGGLLPDTDLVLLGGSWLACWWSWWSEMRSGSRR